MQQSNMIIPINRRKGFRRNAAPGVFASMTSPSWCAHQAPRQKRAQENSVCVHISTISNGEVERARSQAAWPDSFLCRTRPYLFYKTSIRRVVISSLPDRCAERQRRTQTFLWRAKFALLTLAEGKWMVYLLQFLPRQNR